MRRTCSSTLNTNCEWTARILVAADAVASIWNFIMSLFTTTYLPFCGKRLPQDTSYNMGCHKVWNSSSIPWCCHKVWDSSPLPCWYHLVQGPILVEFFIGLFWTNAVPQRVPGSLNSLAKYYLQALPPQHGGQSRVMKQESSEYSTKKEVKYCRVQDVDTSYDLPCGNIYLYTIQRSQLNCRSRFNFNRFLVMH